jgi:hypothetical protein
VFRPLRTAISFAVLGAALWAAFAIDLGGHTFAEHVDTISETPEAKQLIEGTRSTINPALQEVRDRVLGEYVEAPTWIPSERSAAPEREHAPEQIVPASTLGPDDGGFEPALPGGRRQRPAARIEADAMEPSLPGRH